MSTIVRPSIGARVRVTFPAGEWRDAETADGIVIGADHDSIEVRTGETIGETFTLYDHEIAAGATVEAIPAHGPRVKPMVTDDHYPDPDELIYNPLTRWRRL